MNLYGHGLFNHKVRPERWINLCNYIKSRIPDLEKVLCQKYSLESGIDLRYIDLTAAVRGFMYQGYSNEDILSFNV